VAVNAVAAAAPPSNRGRRHTPEIKVLPALSAAGLFPDLLINILLLFCIFYYFLSSFIPVPHFRKKLRSQAILAPHRLAFQ